MNTQQPYNLKHNNGKVFVGFMLLLVGGILLLQQFSWLLIPEWLYSWPVWMIVIGIYIGARNNFRRSSWIIFLIIGIFNLPNEVWPSANFDNLSWPLVIIAVGIWMILRRNQNWDRNKYQNKWHDRFGAGSTDADKAFDANGNRIPPDPNAPAGNYNSSGYKNAHYGDDYLDTVSVFSGAKKTILSKDFKGGEIVNVFGGTELDFSMADINGRVIIEVTQIFGGIKMIVPPHWQVVSDVASIFAGVDDKRRGGIPLNSDKILIIKGTSIFAGIDIRSF